MFYEETSSLEISYAIHYSKKYVKQSLTFSHVTKVSTKYFQEVVEEVFRLIYVNLSR